MPLTNRVRQLRMRRGESLTDVGKAVGLTRQGISMLENGQRQPSAEVMARLARHFGVSMDDLFFLSEELAGAGR